MSKTNTKHWMGVPRQASLKWFYRAWAKICCLFVQNVFLGSYRIPNPEGTPLPNTQTHIDIQNLIGGTFSQKWLSSSAGDLIWSFVGEHCPSTLILPWSINCPVPIDDGAARATSQGCGDKWDGLSGKHRVCTRKQSEYPNHSSYGPGAWIGVVGTPPQAWSLSHLNHYLPCGPVKKTKDGWEWLGEKGWKQKEKDSKGRVRHEDGNYFMYLCHY